MITCPEETRVARAALSGHWPGSLDAHAAQCGVCREVAEASRWMHELSETGRSPETTLDAGLLWWRAQLNQRAAKARRARSPLEFAYVACTVVAAAGLAIWASLNWSAFEAALEWLLAPFRPETAAANNSLGLLQPASFWSIVGIACLVVVFIALPALTED